MKTRYDAAQILKQLDEITPLTSYGIVHKDIVFPFWMFLRVALHNHLCGKIGYSLPDSKKKRRSLLSILKLVKYGFCQRIKKQTKVDVVFLAPAIGKIRDELGNVENVYHGQFARYMANENMSVAILDTIGISINDRYNFLGVQEASLVWIFLKAKVNQMLFHRKIKASDHTTIDTFIHVLHQNLEKLLPIDMVDDQIVLKQVLFNAMQAFHLHYYTWEHIIKRLQPKAIISHCIAYGGYFGMLALMAKAKGILVIENQHGVISSAHPAYNHAHRPLWLPDYFLTYHNDWLKGCDFDVQSIQVGNPYLSKKIKGLVFDAPQYDVMVIADCLRPEKTNDILDSLKKQTGKTILFRPHPREVASLNERYPCLQGATNIDVSINRNVYAEIAKVDIVVMLGNYVSTVAFEARAVGKKIWVLCDDVDYIDGQELLDTDFMLLDDLQDLCQRLGDIPGKQQLNHRHQQYYLLNWQEEIKCFIDHLRKDGCFT